MPKSKGILLILAVLMLTGGILYMRKYDGGEGPGIRREGLSAAQTSGTERVCLTDVQTSGTERVCLTDVQTAGTERDPALAVSAETSKTSVRGMSSGTETAAGEASDVETAAVEAAETAPCSSETEWIFATEPLLININTAGQADLERLPGIGPAKARAILRYREENGLFQTVEDLMKVPGIKEGTFYKIRNYITV